MSGTEHIAPAELKQLMREHFTAHLSYIDTELTLEPIPSKESYEFFMNEVRESIQSYHNGYVTGRHQPTPWSAEELLTAAGYQRPYSDLAIIQVKRAMQEGSRDAFRVTLQRMTASTERESELASCLLPLRALQEQSIVSAETNCGARGNTEAPRCRSHTNEDAVFPTEENSSKSWTQQRNGSAHTPGALIALFEKHAEAQMKFDAWTEKTRNQSGQTLRMFVSFAGEKQPRAYKGADMLAFRDDFLARLPTNYGKAKEYQGLTFNEIIAKGERVGAKTLSIKTINRHMSALNAFWKWLRQAGKVEVNIADGLAARQRARKNNAVKPRRAITAEEIRILLSSPLYTGCQSVGRRSLPGQLIIKDALYWIPLFELFNGLRLSEIALASVEDVLFLPEYKAWFLRLEESEDRHLKTNSSRRPVPIHQELLDRGFLDYVDERRASGDKRLFPKAWGNDSKQLTAPIYKKISRYFSQVGVGETNVRGHAQRHSFLTRLLELNISWRTTSLLAGHLSIDEQEIWSLKGSPTTRLYQEDTKVLRNNDITAMLAAIRKLFFDLDHSSD